MLFMAPQSASYLYLVIWLLVFYSGASVVGLAHAAWAGSLTKDYNGRARVFGFVQALALAGSVLAMLAPLISTRFFPEADESGVHAMGWTMIALTPLLTLLAARTPEQLTPPPPRTKVHLAEYWQIVSRPSVRRILLADLAFALGPLSLGPIFIFYWRDARGFTIPEANLMLVIFMVAGLFGAPFWASLAQRLGKHRTIVISALAWIAFQAVVVFLPDRSVLCFVLMFCLGFANSAMLTLIRALVADIADEVRLDFGKERSGFLYSLVTSTQKVGGAVSVAFTFWVLAWVGYVPGAGPTNTAEHMRGLELLYALAPSGFQLLGLIVFIGFPMTAAKHAEIRAALAARDSAARDASPDPVPPDASPQVGPLPRGV
jgi:Na+/melibiose symporter-like transporter